MTSRSAGRPSRGPSGSRSRATGRPAGREAHAMAEPSRSGPRVKSNPSPSAVALRSSVADPDGNRRIDCPAPATPSAPFACQTAWAGGTRRRSSAWAWRRCHPTSGPNVRILVHHDSHVAEFQVAVDDDLAPFVPGDFRPGKIRGAVAARFRKASSMSARPESNQLLHRGARHRFGPLISA